MPDVAKLNQGFPKWMVTSLGKWYDDQRGAQRQAGVAEEHLMYTVKF